jgi:2-iminobutanoate/2-iminopropanoate deaminase
MKGGKNMARKVIHPEGLPKTVGPYSHCAVGEGTKWVFIAGQVSQDEKGTLVGKGDVEAQTRQVLANLQKAVAAAGGTVGDICKITIFVVDLDDAAYEAIARVRRDFFMGDYPASTLVEVKRLASPDWRIEIEGYAVF